MTRSWKNLTDLTQGNSFLITKVHLPEQQVSIEGQFEPPPLAKLSIEDQVFVSAFVRCHGSIKEMEQTFGMSYPSVKNRLNKIAERLEFVEVNPPPSSMEILLRIEKGELKAREALEEIKKTR